MTPSSVICTPSLATSRTSVISVPRRIRAPAGTGAGKRTLLTPYLWMTTEWLQLVRADLRLPVERLPADWPAVRGQEVLPALRERHKVPARRLADETIVRLTPAVVRRCGSRRVSRGPPG